MARRRTARMPKIPRGAGLLLTYFRAVGNNYPNIGEAFPEGPVWFASNQGYVPVKRRGWHPLSDYHRRLNRALGIRRGDWRNHYEEWSYQIQWVEIRGDVRIVRKVFQDSTKNFTLDLPSRGRINE